MPANTFGNGETHTAVIVFEAVISTNSALPGSINFASYNNGTRIQIVTVPSLTLKTENENSLMFTFTGTLQESTDLKTWSDVSPQPTSPWQMSIRKNIHTIFYRVRNN